MVRVMEVAFSNEWPHAFVKWTVNSSRYGVVKIKSSDGMKVKK